MIPRMRQGCGPRAALAAVLALGALASGGAARAEPPLVPTREARQPPMPDRVHERGATLLRFREDRLLFALVLDAKPAKIEERRVTLSDGRTIDFRWSSRSLWIAGEKFELPFGDIILVSTRDSVRARALEFRAVRGDLLLAQLAADSVAALWLDAHGVPGGAPLRGDAQAATEPRHTTEVVEWTWRGLHALTFVLSGEPLVAVVADRPVTAGSSRTSLGAFVESEIRIGPPPGGTIGVNAREARVTIRDGADHPVARERPLGDGRAFLFSTGAIRQVDVRFDLGPGAAAALLERIEALPEVARHLGLGAAE